MAAYSQDLRDRVLRALERGDSPTNISKRFEVSRVYVYDVKRRWKTEGERKSRQIGGYRVSRIAPFERDIREWINKEPDMTLEELALRIKQTKDVQIKIGALWHQLNRWGLSFKKNSARQRARTPRRGKSTAFLD